MPNRKQDNVAQLNQGVNYMDPNQPAVPAQPVTQGQPAPVQPVVQGQPAPVQPVAQQPIVNTDALKAQAGNLANNAKAGVNAFVEKVKTDKGVMIGAIVGVVLVVLLVVMVGSKLLNPAYNITNKYMKIVKKGDEEKIVKVYSDEMLEALYDGEKDDLEDEFKEAIEKLEDEDIVIKSYKIRECETYSKDQLEDLAESFETLYDIDEKDVKAAKRFHVKVVYDNDGEKTIDYVTVTVVKVGKKWSIYRGLI